MVPNLDDVKQVNIAEKLLSDGMPEWVVSDQAGNVQALHSLMNEDWASPSVWIMSPTNPCLVLGSSQDDSCINYQHAKKVDVSIARRRTGGGAVFVDPQTLFWVDLFVPRTHRIWQDDIEVASVWMGRVWKNALNSMGVDCQMYNKPFEKGPLADLVCFAGRAPGELLIREKKILGISQRRMKEGVRFQCALTLGWKPEEWVNLFTAASSRNLRSEIYDAGTYVALDRKEILIAFMDALTLS